MAAPLPVVSSEDSASDAGSASHTVRKTPDGAILFDANVTSGKDIKAVEVKCKIEYE